MARPQQHYAGLCPPGPQQGSLIITPFLPGPPLILLFCAFSLPPILNETHSGRGAPRCWVPQSRGCNRDDEVSCGSWQVSHLAGPWFSEVEGEHPLECLPKPDSEGGSAPSGHPHSFIHSAVTWGLTLGSRQGAGLLLPELRDLGGSSGYTQNGAHACHVLGRMCGILRRS